MTAMNKIVLTEEGLPTGCNASVLRHLAAERCRDCWRLWNQGFPLVRIVDHFPEGDNYIVYFDDNAMETLNPSKWKGKINITNLVIFLIDLDRLREGETTGEYRLSVHRKDLNFGDQSISDYEFLLVPEFSDIVDSDSLGRTDFLKLAKIAVKTACPEQYSSISKAKSISSIISNLDGVRLRLKNPETKELFNGRGELVFNPSNSDIDPQIIDSEGKIRFLYSNPQGILRAPIASSGFVAGFQGIRVPILFTTKGSMLPWSSAVLRWRNDFVARQNDGEQSLQRDFLASRLAEVEHYQRHCVRYLVQSEGKGRTITLKLEPDKGGSNAVDFWEGGIKSGEMKVALNQLPGVIEWEESDLWLMDGISESDPFTLRVRPTYERVGKDLRESGWIKPADIRQDALIRRKKKIVEQGTLNRIMHCHLLDDSGDWRSRRKHWRLKSEGALQLLQGPPGTGKTYTATKIIKDTLLRNPYARILVSAKEHLPLNHLCESIEKEISEFGHKVVRIRTNVGPNPLPPSRIGMQIVDEIASLMDDEEEKMSFIESSNEGGRIATWVEDLAVKTATVVCTTTLDKAMELMLWRGEATFDLSIVEEAGKSYPSEIIAPLAISMESILIGDQQQLPPFELREIGTSLTKVIDNCLSAGSRDANTLTNLSIAPWVLGDLSEEERLEFIARMFEETVPWLQPFSTMYDSMAKSTDFLDGQFRMFRELSDAVGSIFYGNPFNWRKGEIGGNRIPENELPAPWIERGRLLIIDHSHCSVSNRGEEPSKGGTIRNIAEAETAGSLLTSLLEGGFEAKAITPYLGQVEAIQSNTPIEFRDHVTTVDAFQGKEADFIILSMVRNNRKTGARRRWGFMTYPPRLNVALSRAKEGLALVTSVQQIEETDWEEERSHLSLFHDNVKQFGCVISSTEIGG